MRISELISLLEDALQDGDCEVFLLEDNKAYQFMYLGQGAADWGDYFWLSAESISKTTDQDPRDFLAPAYEQDRSHLKVVK